MDNGNERLVIEAMHQRTMNLRDKQPIESVPKDNEEQGRKYNEEYEQSYSVGDVQRYKAANRRYRRGMGIGW